MTHRDGFSDLSARRSWRSDAIPKPWATTPESSEKPPYRSLWGRFGVCQQALPMNYIACGLLPTRIFPKAIPMGHY